MSSKGADTTQNRQILFVQEGVEGAHVETQVLAATLTSALAPENAVRYPKFSGLEDVVYGMVEVRDKCRAVRVRRAVHRGGALAWRLRGAEEKDGQTHLTLSEIYPAKEALDRNIGST